jgi:hypothetical protein
MVSEYADTLAKFRSAHSLFAIESHLRTARLQRTNALDYAKFFALKAPRLESVPVLDAKRRAWAQSFDAGRVERSRRAHEARQARWEAVRAESTKRYEQERENARKSLPERVASWRQGEHVSFYSDALEFAMLRLIEKDGSPHVETSQGVKVPVQGPVGAAKLFRFLKALKDAGRTYTRNGHTQHIGNFAVDSFSPITVAGFDPDWISEAVAKGYPQFASQEWVMVSGCHRIKWSEIEDIAPAVLAAEAQGTVNLNPFGAGTLES